MNAEQALRRGTLGLLSLACLVVGFFLASCGSVNPPPENKPLTQAASVRPTWRAGDRWLHAWSTGAEKGIKESEVLGLQEVRGVQYFVVRMGPVNAYFTMDLHWAWAATAAESRVTSRAIPPLPWFNWPLEIGKRWVYQGVLEDQEGKDRLQDTYRVVSMEEVTVPAGTFLAFRIVHEAGSSIVDQYWYAPNVRWYVKWLGRRGNDEFQEVLEQYLPAPQNTSPTPPK